MSHTKFKVLIAYFVESNQQSDSFPAHNFLQETTRATVCCLLYQLNKIFSSLRLDIQSLNIYFL